MSELDVLLKDLNVFAQLFLLAAFCVDLFVELPQQIDCGVALARCRLVSGLRDCPVKERLRMFGSRDESRRENGLTYVLCVVLDSLERFSVVLHFVSLGNSAD